VKLPIGYVMFIMKDSIRICLKELRWNGLQAIDWIPVASNISYVSFLCKGRNEISKAMR